MHQGLVPSLQSAKIAGTEFDFEAHESLSLHSFDGKVVLLFIIQAQVSRDCECVKFLSAHRYGTLVF